MAKPHTPRFARAVEKVTRHTMYQYTASMAKRDAAKLLQREHAAVVRKVKADAKLAVKVLKITRDTKEEMLAEGQRQYCAELLAWLHERGR